MVYEYHCEKCAHTFDVIKSAKYYDTEELCTKCHEVAVRKFAPKHIHLSQTAVQEAEYNPGLGCITKNRQHRAEIAKQKGVEEIGNEKPDSLHKHFEKAREETREKVWADADKGWVGSDG